MIIYPHPPLTLTGFITFKPNKKLYKYKIISQCQVKTFTLSYFFRCVNLLQQIQLRIKPQYQVFGHVQEGKGLYNVKHWINLIHGSNQFKVLQVAIADGLYHSCTNQDIKEVSL